MGETGNWSYTKNDANTATLVFTYDEDGNDPNVYREQAVLTFTGEGEGTSDYGECTSNVLDSSSVIDDAPFTLN